MGLVEFIYLATPMTAAIVVWLFFLQSLYKNSNSFPLVDVGFVFATIILIYTCIPLLSVLIAGVEITNISDNRLRVLAPDAEKIGMFFWFNVTFLAGFTVSYASFRQRWIKVDRLIPVGGAMRHSVIFLVFAITGFFLFLRFFMGIDVSPSYNEYAEKMYEYAAMPLLLRQILGHLGGILFIAKLALLAIVFQNIRNPTWRNFGVLWIGIEVLMPFFQLGSRGNALLLGVGAVMFYNIYVKPLGGVKLFAFALIALFGFFFQGILRSTTSFDELQGLDIFSASNEFQSVFATSFDLYKRYTEDGLVVPWQIYIADFIRILPQQLSPFLKIDQSEWYLDEIGYKGEGVGFTFGAVAESVIGFGSPQLFFQGVLLGWVLAKIHTAYTERAGRLLWIVFYVWFCTIIYVAFRNSTFYWLTFLIYDFGMYVALLSFLRSIIYRRR